MKAAVRKGFTLIEILIVVIILGILAAIVIPQFTNASQDAKVSALQTTVQSVQSQVELYKFQTNQLPGTNGTVEAKFWTDLGSKTTIDGKVVGPWISSASINPFTNAEGVVFGGALAATATPAATVNWYFDTANGKFYGNIKSQTAYFPAP